MARDKVLAISLELQSLAIVLANQIAQPRLSEADTRSKLSRQLPFEFLGCSVDGVTGSRRAVGAKAPRRLVGFGVGRKLSVEECWSRGVNGAGEEHQAFSEDISGESKDCVSVYAGVLKVDTRRAVSANDDLELKKHISTSLAYAEGKRHTLSYHRLVHVPTCSPASNL